MVRSGNKHGIGCFLVRNAASSETRRRVIPKVSETQRQDPFTRNTVPYPSVGNTALYSIYREHGVVLNLSGTQRHIPFIRNTASYLIYQEHGVIFNLSGTRRHIPFIRNKASYCIYQEHGAIFNLSGTQRHIPFIRNWA